MYNVHVYYSYLVVASQQTKENIWPSGVRGIGGDESDCFHQACWIF